MKLAQVWLWGKSAVWCTNIFTARRLEQTVYMQQNIWEVCCKIYSKILTVLFGFSQWHDHLSSVWRHIGAEYQKTCVTFVRILVYRCSKTNLYKYVYRLQRTQSQNRGQVKLMAGLGSGLAWITSALSHRSRNSLYWWLHLLWVIICFRGAKCILKKKIISASSISPLFAVVLQLCSGTQCRSSVFFF